MRDILLIKIFNLFKLEMNFRILEIHALIKKISLIIQLNQ